MLKYVGVGLPRLKWSLIYIDRDLLFSAIVDKALDFRLIYNSQWPKLMNAVFQLLLPHWFCLYLCQ